MSFDSASSEGQDHLKRQALNQRDPNLQSPSVDVALPTAWRTAVDLCTTGTSRRVPRVSTRMFDQPECGARLCTPRQLHIRRQLILLGTLPVSYENPASATLLSRPYYPRSSPGPSSGQFPILVPADMRPARHHAATATIRTTPSTPCRTRPDKRMAGAAAPHRDQRRPNK